jgi:hypothetical protein
VKIGFKCNRIAANILRRQTTIKEALVKKQGSFASREVNSDNQTKEIRTIENETATFTNTLRPLKTDSAEILDFINKFN